RSQTFTGPDMFNHVATFNSSANFNAGVVFGTSSSDYQQLVMGGGNSYGYLYGSYPVLGDGIHLSYNYYANPSIGIVCSRDGATPRISVGYGTIVLAVGDIGAAPTTERLVADTSGVTVNGTFNNHSDRNAKQDFTSVSPLDILEAVAQLPLSEWSYKE